MRVAPESNAVSDEFRGYACDPGWSTEEFGGVEFQDARLQKRFLVVSAQLAAQPQASINQACEDWASTKGAYRLFENPKVEPARILAPHQQRTCARMLGQTRILALQDTCYVNYTSHPATQGLGLIGADQDGQVGLIMHSTLAMTAEGLPLGLLTQTIWARPEADPEDDAAARRGQRRQRPVEAKESGKWLKAVRETQAVCPAGLEVVHLCDREADFYELFQEVYDLGAQMVVRASQDRAVMEGGQIRQVLSQRPVSGSLTVEIPAQQGRAARTATVEVRYGEVTLRPPYRSPACQVTFCPLQVWGVGVREVDPPAEVEAPLGWLLLTNVPVTSFLDAAERVRWYRLRWQIEVFHRVLKSGCTVEECRLDQAEELKRYLTLKSVIAWRLYWMVQIARVQPEAACTIVLADHEWQALYVAIHRTSHLPETIPTVRQVVRWIAQLGGFLGRTSDGEPGVTVIWRGWQRLHDVATMWLVLHGTPDGK